jgi:xylulokinase
VYILQHLEDSMKYLLAHDLGTSGNKATLFSQEGQLIKSCVIEYESNYYNGNYVEQNPEDWWRAVCLATQGILNEINPKDVSAVSFSGQMMGCVCVDRNGNLLRQAIIWADQRATDEAVQLSKKIDAKQYFNYVGHRNSASYGLQKFMWIKNNQPEIYRHTYKVLNAKDYIVYKLTGNFISEYTDASGMAALDIHKMEWCEPVITAAGIDGEKLPELNKSTYVAGEVSQKASQECGLVKGTTVVCGGGDGCCAAIGAGCVREGKTYCALGSSSWIMTTAEQPIVDNEMTVFNWPSMVEGLVNPCGTMQAAGVSYSWMKEVICTEENIVAQRDGSSVYQLINNQIDSALAGSNDMIFLPYLMGERSPWWNSNARGAFVGIKREHTRAELLRAVVEGVTLNLNIILDTLKNYIHVESLNIIGGGAKNAVWRQIMADVFGVDIFLPDHVEEATSMGAAIAGGIGVGIFKGFDIVDQFMKIKTIVHPQRENTKKYRNMMPIFKECYGSLTEIFEKLAKM